MWTFATNLLLLICVAPSYAESGQKLCETDERLCFTGICKVKECQKCTRDAFCTTTNPDQIVPKGLQLMTLTLDLTYNGPEAELTQAMMSYLTHLKTLTIRGNIRSIASNTFFNQTTMSHLIISGSKIRVLPDKLFSNKKKLRYLELPDNLFTDIPANIFSQIPNIQRLDFSENPLESCKSETIAPELANLTQLRDVRLGGYGRACGIEICRNITKDHFLPIQNIQILDLSNSLVFFGDQRVLEPLVRLSFLTIDNVSPYKECPSNAKELFKSLPPKLSTITFHDWATTETVNQSCFLTNDSLIGLKQLPKLSTFDCRYSDKIFGDALHSSIFEGFQRLKIIYLHWCGLASIESGVFNSTDQAVNIGLSGNLLGARALKLYTSNQTSKVKSLSLKGVGIGAATYHAYYLIEAFPQLQNLYLDDNYLNTIPEFGYEKNLTSPLTTLTLNNNELTSFSADAGRYLCQVMPELLHFQAEENMLTDISGLIFCPKLEQLSLANNELGRNQNQSFQAIGQLYNLEHLDLSSNKINSLNSTLLQNLTVLRTLILANNEIHALEDTVFSTTPFLASLDLSVNVIPVLKAVTVSNGLSNLRNFYLQANQITTLTPELLKAFDKNITKLKYLGLLGNPLTCSCDQIFANWVRNSSFIIQVKNLNCSTPENPAVTTQVISFKPNPFLCYIKVPLIVSGIVLGCVILSILIAIPCYKYRWYFWHPQVVTRAVAERLTELEFEQKCEYDAFISYDASSDSDTTWVMRKLIPSIETVSTEGEKKLKLYAVDRDSAAGSPKHTEQCRAIQASRKIIILLSNSYLANPNCLSEADLVAGYQLVDGAHCYQPNRILVILLEELDEEVLRAPVTSLLTHNVISIADSQAKMNRVWKRVKRFVAKPRYVYRKKNRALVPPETPVDEQPTERSPLIQ